MHEKATKKKTTAGRTKALLIKPAEGRTYAKLLKGIKTSIKPEEFGVNIKAIRQTRNGHVLLELSKKTANSSAYTEAIKTTVGQNDIVRGLVPLVTLEIRDIDSVTSEEDVRAALKRDLGETAEIGRVY